MEQQIQHLQAALSTMYSNADYSAKTNANDFLQKFKNSQEAWDISHFILNSETGFDIQTKLFAAQTLRSKISYSLSTLPNDSLDGLKNSLIELLLMYTVKKMKVIRTQLNISLVSLALQHLDWEDPVNDIITIFETKAQSGSLEEYLSSLLEFLKILPEECSSINRTPLTEKQFKARTNVLLVKNKSKILDLLVQLSSTSSSKEINRSTLDCLNSWINEIRITSILSNESLYQLIFKNLLIDSNFDIAIESLISIIKETAGIENIDVISSLYSELINLKSLLYSEFDNYEVVNGITRLFVEIGETWNTAIVKNVEYFKDLVEIILKCCEYDDLDIIRYTFNFWFSTSNLLAAPVHTEERELMKPVFHRLIEIIIQKLRYPIPDGDEDTANGRELTTRELFDGDIESEEKFKEFRYEMGDVLKECCFMVGSDDALSVAYNEIESLVVTGSNGLKHWQNFEAPLFSLRSMAKEIKPRESSTILNNVFNLLINLIEKGSPIMRFNKIRYAIILFFGRYTEYSYYNFRSSPIFKAQLDFVIQSLLALLNQETAKLSESEEEIVSACSNSLMYICQDCGDLLLPFIDEFYNLFCTIRTKKNLNIASLYEITDGFASVVYRFDDDSKVYEYTKLFIKDTLGELDVFNKNSPEVLSKHDDNLFKLIADKIELVNVFLSIMVPKDPEASQNLIANLIIETFPVFQECFKNFHSSDKVSERLVKYIKNQIEIHRTYLIPILNDIMKLVNDGYKLTNFGCYLWMTGITIREFNDEYVDEGLKDMIFEFGKLQSNLFLSWLNSHLEDVNVALLLTNSQAGSSDLIEHERKKIVDRLVYVEDKIEDFYRMMDEIVTYFPFKFILDLKVSNQLVGNTFQMAVLGLNLNKYDSANSILRYLTNFLGWGNEKPPISYYATNPPEVRETLVKFLMTSPNGQEMNPKDSNALLLFNQCLKSLIFSLPKDCEYDCYNLIANLVKLVLSISNDDVELIKFWIEFSINDLPEGTVNDQEKFKVLSEVESAVKSKLFRNFRIAITNFVKYYLRKNKTTLA